MEISQRVRHFCASLICATSAPSRSLASTAAAFFEAARGRGGGGGKGVYKKLPITGANFRPWLESTHKFDDRSISPPPPCGRQRCTQGT